MKKKMEAVNGGTVTPYLPEEITVNILKRLPAKSLLRFQCVCKHWKTLIKTQSFMQIHHHHSTHHSSSLLIGPVGTHNYGFCLLSSNFDLQLHRLGTIPFRGHLWIVGSTNGLICFLSCSVLSLWNPATREVRKVPIHQFSNCCSNYGFGFSNVVNDYRIVRVCLELGKGAVYSLSKGCWREFQFESIKDVYIWGHSLNADGVIFWRGLKNTRQDPAYPSYDVTVSFDLAKEVFKVILLPRPPLDFSIGQLFVHDDKLALMYYGVSEKSGYAFYRFLGVDERAIDSSRERWSLGEMFIGNYGCSLYYATICRNRVVFYEVVSLTEYGTEGFVIPRLYLIDVVANECKQFEFIMPKFGGLLVFNYAENLLPIGGNIEIEEPGKPFTYWWQH